MYTSENQHVRIDATLSLDPSSGVTLSFDPVGATLSYSFDPIGATLSCDLSGATLGW